MNTMHRIALAAGILLAGAATASPIANADDVRAALLAAGYADVREIERDDGLWEAEVRGPDGRWHDLHLVADSGRVLDPRAGTLLNADDIRAQLEAAGYTNIRDLDREGGIWEADATSPDGLDVDLRIAADDGSILEEDIDD